MTATVTPLKRAEPTALARLRAQQAEDKRAQHVAAIGIMALAEEAQAQLAEGAEALDRIPPGVVGIYARLAAHIGTELTKARAIMERNP